ncbi:MAG: hypothetical protein COB46_13740 [Rhodospirillaceae bacterium]|nr:MAG: hypothetical protein COB46_13740 [Rhodospirillaceae bacterium]
MLARTPKPTKVFDTFWRFAVERQNLFYRRIETPSASQWTDDAILERHKFTNAYRAADRVSQYLIRNVIYSGDQTPEEVFFRTILFKLFNKIETWELLKDQLGDITWREFKFQKYDTILTKAMANKATIYSGAYIMASGRSAFGHAKKHRNHLGLLQKMMDDRLPDRIKQAPSMATVYDTLHDQPSIGDFLAYQYAIDLNYSTLTDFSENDFVMPGPGSLRGIAKCFSDSGNLSPSDIIRFVTENQEHELEKRGLKFNSLWGRPLHLIDVQNLFCEVDKYSRVFHPEISSADGRKRIKQLFRPSSKPIAYFFPPKWGLNDKTPENLEGARDTLF